mgnify:FL=1
MKITKKRLQQIIQEEVNSHKASQLNESIDVETVDNLEAAIKQAYQEMTTSTDVDQTYADTGEPVSKDPEVMHQKAVEMIMQIVSEVTDTRFQSNRVSEGDLDEGMMGIAKALAFAIAMSAAPGSAIAASDPVQTSQTGDPAEQDIDKASVLLAQALKELGINPTDSGALDVIHNATQSLVDGDSGPQDSGE